MSGNDQHQPPFGATEPPQSSGGIRGVGCFALGCGVLVSAVIAFLIAGALGIQFVDTPHDAATVYFPAAIVLVVGILVSIAVARRLSRPRR